MPKNRDIAHMQDGPQKVFVYGTLKRGFGNHYGHLGDARMLGIGSVWGTMFHLGEFPAITTAEHMLPLAGEIYETDWEHIFNMDLLEGVASGNFYDRIQVKIPPYGSVWTYAFSEKNVNSRISTQNLWAIPSGCWRGPETPSVRWLGFGKGVEVGTFVTNAMDNEIKIGRGDNPPYTLLREKEEWVLFHKETGEAIGKFKYLKDILGIGAKPRISLRPNTNPQQNPPVGTPIVHPTVRDIMEGRARAHSSTSNTIPVIWTPQGQADIEPKEPEIPQAAKLLGLKYREA